MMPCRYSGFSRVAPSNHRAAKQGRGRENHTVATALLRFKGVFYSNCCLKNGQNFQRGDSLDLFGIFPVDLLKLMVVNLIDVTFKGYFSFFEGKDSVSIAFCQREEVEAADDGDAFGVDFA